MVVEHAPLEDELGDVLEKALRHIGMSEQSLSDATGIDLGRIRDAFDWRYDLCPAEIQKLAKTLGLNEVGVAAMAEGRYPLPEIAGLPFCLYPLRMRHGVGVANAYVVADCRRATGLLFDCGVSGALLRRTWPKGIRTLQAIFITHAETEHIGGLEELRREFPGVPVFGPRECGVAGVGVLADGATLGFDGFDVEAWSTPGHVEHHHCYVVRVPKVVGANSLLISGDVLFAGSVGSGFHSVAALNQSVARLFARLPEKTVVAPGHGPLTTIKNERIFNPFVK